MNNSIAITNKRKLRSTAILLGILVFIRTMPCYLWAFEDILRPLCAILILVISLLHLSKEKWTIWIFISIAWAYVWATVFIDHSPTITVFNFLAFAFIPIIRKDLLLETYKVYYKIITTILALSIINYLFYLIGIRIGGITIAPLNTLREHTYVLYPFLVVPSVETSRFFAIFDEPGVVGTICGLLLVAENMNLKRRMNLVVLVAGLLSFSMFFYISASLSILLFSSNKHNRIKYLFVGIVFVLLTYNIPYIYDAIWYRFEFNPETETFVGDNRTGGAVGEMLESVWGTPLFFTGMGSSFVEQFKGEASLKLIILQYGFIFVFFNVLGYAILAFREISNRKEWLYFMVFFFCVIYQRPGFIDTASIFLFTMVIYAYSAHFNKNSINR